MPIHLLYFYVGELALDVVRVYKHVIKVVRSTGQVYLASAYILLAVVGIEADASAQAREELLTLPNFWGYILSIIADGILYILNLRSCLVLKTNGTRPVEVALADPRPRTESVGASTPTNHTGLAILGAAQTPPGAVPRHRGSIGAQSLRSRHP